MTPGRRDRRHAVRRQPALGLDIGPETASALRRRHPRIVDGLLERPDGRVRDGRRSRPAPRPSRRHSPRSTGFASSAAGTRRPRCAAGLPRRPIRPHIDRGRGQPRIPRGQAASRTGGTRMAVTTEQAATPLIAGNWKMNLDHLQAIAFVQKLAWSSRTPSTTSTRSRSRCSRRSPTCALCRPSSRADKLALAFGAQDVSAHDSGAYTGEISGAFLAALDVPYVIIGHSERREYARGDRRRCRREGRAALRHGLVPVICVGESAEDLERHGPSAVPVAQLRAALDGVPTPAQTSSSPTSRSGRSAPDRRPRPSRPRTGRRRAARGLAEALGAEAAAAHPDPLRRVGEGGEHREIHARAQRRRRPGRRSEPRHRRVLQHRAVPEARRRLSCQVGAPSRKLY